MFFKILLWCVQQSSESGTDYKLSAMFIPVGHRRSTYWSFHCGNCMRKRQANIYSLSHELKKCLLIV